MLAVSHEEHVLYVNRCKKQLKCMLNIFINEVKKNRSYYIPSHTSHNIIDHIIYYIYIYVHHISYIDKVLAKNKECKFPKTKS